MPSIGVDVGGTKIAIGLVHEDGHILDKLIQPTPRDPAAACAAIAEAVRRLTARHQVVAVGLGLPGFVTACRQQLLFAPNLPGWERFPLGEALARQIGLPVVLENDANAAAWGEAAFGAGRGRKNLVCLTLGTGLGGGVVVDGRLQRGTAGFAGEVGHLQVVADGRLCGCGLRGCWERYASGPALREEAQARAGKRPAAAAALLAMGDGSVAGITAEHVTLAAAGEDDLALEAVTAVGSWLGRGLATLTAVLDPELFVIGGGLSHAGDLLLQPAKRALAAALPAREHRDAPELQCAELANEAGIIGSAHLARLQSTTELAAVPA